MSQPIKVSDELYARLKDRAEAEGFTLQDALVEIITTPHEGLVRFEAELANVRNEMASGGRSRKTLEDQIVKLAKRVDQLFELRDKDIANLNSWVETWQRIQTLTDDVIKLEEKVEDLDRLSHRHVWQEVDE